MINLKHVIFFAYLLQNHSILCSFPKKTQAWPNIWVKNTMGENGEKLSFWEVLLEFFQSLEFFGA